MIAALILAAGLSSRMGGQHKILLPWHEGHTILSHIIDQLHNGGVDRVVVVTGHRAENVQAAAAQAGAQTAFNPDYCEGEMLTSIQVGLRALPEDIRAVLLVLGDQPRIQAQTVSAVIAAYTVGQGTVIAPSYQMRRGHPLLIDRSLWEALLALSPTQTLRDVLRDQPMGYVVVDNDSVLSDIDTPEEYQRQLTQGGAGA